MVRTGSTVNLSKFNICVQNCTKCNNNLDTSQKPVHETLILNPSPILFVSQYAHETDITTSQYFTSPGGLWLRKTMDNFLSRKDWTVHSLIMCSVQSAKTVDYKSVMNNCLHHYSSIIELLAPYRVVFMGIPDKPAFKKWKERAIEPLYLDDPNEFVFTNNRLAMSRFTLTVRKLCDEKSTLG